MKDSYLPKASRRSDLASQKGLHESLMKALQTCLHLHGCSFVFEEVWLVFMGFVGFLLTSLNWFGFLWMCHVDLQELLWTHVDFVGFRRPPAMFSIPVDLYLYLNAKCYASGQTFQHSLGSPSALKPAISDDQTEDHNKGFTKASQTCVYFRSFFDAYGFLLACS